MKQKENIYLTGDLSDVQQCAALGPHFEKVAAFLQRRDLKALPNGRYQLDGEDAWATIQEVTLKEWGTGRPEVHREFFDVHVPLSGAETIGVGRFDPSVSGSFEEEKDIGFYDGTPLEPLILRPGQFAVLYPEICAHAPCCDEVGGDVLRKIVIKVRKSAE